MDGLTAKDWDQIGPWCSGFGEEQHRAARVVVRPTRVVIRDANGDIAFDPAVPAPVETFFLCPVCGRRPSGEETADSFRQIGLEPPDRPITLQATMMLYEAQGQILRLHAEGKFPINLPNAYGFPLRLHSGDDPVVATG